MQEPNLKLFLQFRNASAQAGFGDAQRLAGRGKTLGVHNMNKVSQVIQIQHMPPLFYFQNDMSDSTQLNDYRLVFIIG